MRALARMDGTRAVLDDGLARLERATTAAMREATTGLKEELRDQVEAAGLGPRLAKTWQGNTYPKSGTSLEPAGYVYSKAPKIVSFFNEGQVVKATRGRFLAIPTDDTPRKRGGRPLSVDEVETRYGRRLQFVSPGDGGFRTPSTRRGGVAFLVMPGLVIRKSSQRWRNAGPLDKKRGRATQSVIMFILVPEVAGQKKLDLEGPTRRWAARVPGAIEKHFED